MPIITRSQAKPRADRASQPQPVSVSIEEIERVAYELYERRGRVDGYDQQDWFEAEQLLRQRRQSWRG